MTKLFLTGILLSDTVLSACGDRDVLVDNRSLDPAASSTPDLGEGEASQVQVLPLTLPPKRE